MSETDREPRDRTAAIATPERGQPQSAKLAGPARLAGPASRWRRPGWLVVVVPAAVSFVVGGYQIGGPSLWRDEAYTKDAIGRSVSQIFALLGHQDAVHGGYYLLMHVLVAAIGTSDVALRFPSLCAMVIATAFTAAIGRRAAALVQDPDAAGRDGGHVPALTGLLSGLVFATAPYMTYYAQMARSYAIVTMFATISTYLLLRACPQGRRGWWLAYAVTVALTGLFNLFGLLILVAHGVTLLLTKPRGRPGNGRRLGRVPLPWLAACAAALIVLSPLLRLSYREQKQISWLARPDASTIERLFYHFAGSKELVVPVALLVLAGVAAGCIADHWRPLNPAAIALPWLVVPPFLLIAGSYVKPVYVERYVEFCLPALAILVASGLVGLLRAGSRTPLGRLGLTWVPPAVVGLGIAVMLIGPQHAIRQSAARPDNLRLASAIVAAHEQPGDVVFYLPLNMHVLGTGYPAPFRRLRNIAQASPPLASATLTGTEITSPALLKSRFTDVRRVWVVTGASNYKFPAPGNAVDKEKLALLAGMHIIHRWMAGEVMLTLYGP
ncbi:MAG: glycosyltransferase family 39 protein [Actinomycetota bacterium]|nr:glycosyltransferase family 39 protein [Actinomycetota bacterium]